MANNNIKTNIYIYCNTLQHEKVLPSLWNPNGWWVWRSSAFDSWRNFFLLSRSCGLYMLYMCRECFSYDTLEQRMEGEPIWVSTLSSHWRGPFRCSSIQQGVLVTVCRLTALKRERDMYFIWHFLSNKHFRWLVYEYPCTLIILCMPLFWSQITSDVSFGQEHVLAFKTAWWSRTVKALLDIFCFKLNATWLDILLLSKLNKIGTLNVI